MPKRSVLFSLHNGNIRVQNYVSRCFRCSYRRKFNIDLHEHPEPFVARGVLLFPGRNALFRNVEQVVQRFAHRRVRVDGVAEYFVVHAVFHGQGYGVDNLLRIRAEERTPEYLARFGVRYRLEQSVRLPEGLGAGEGGGRDLSDLYIFACVSLIPVRESGGSMNTVYGTG